MSYQALLFCPDEKTARVVTQVLSELEFNVEACHEPFAAVKKLMAQHFDAIVVDCDNEQNAALLFKSARNSSSNQASLSVAMVEGQAGVAKAFRLGANLVLTKPIHVEQSKGTLRVARGLLRKGQAAKPAVSAFPEPVVAPPLAAPSSLPPSRAVAPPPVASASAFELDAEPTPEPDTVDAALLEYMPDSAPPSAAGHSPQSAQDSTPSKQYPWQPRKPMAEPMASALRRAAEAAGKTEFENPAASHIAAPPAGSGAAAAPARAKEVRQSDVKQSEVRPPSKVAPFESTATVAAQPARGGSASEAAQDSSAAEVWESPSAAQPVQAPSFASLHQGANDGQQASGKKTLLIAVLLLGLAAAGYFGWTKMQSRHPEAGPHAIVPTETGTATLPPAPAPPATEAQPPSAEVVAQALEPVSNTPGATPSSSKPSAAIVAEGPVAKTSAKPEGTASPLTTLKGPATTTTEPAPALVVKNGPSAQPKVGAAVQEPEQPPTATSIATGTDNAALTGLVNTNAISAQKPAQQTLRISQGVSQGLILKRVQPLYPAQALQMRLEGMVELQANISKTGETTGIRQLSGPAILGRAAIEAVRQWKYKPYYLNGEPVEVQTQIAVNFKLP